MNNATLKQEVMLRVKTIHTMRRIIHPFRLKIAVFLSGFALSNILVSVPNVLYNMISGLKPNQYFTYLFDALVHTEVVVQATVLLTIVVGLWMVKDVVIRLKYILPKAV